MDSKEFRKHGYEFVDWIADYLENIEENPVQPTVKPGEIKSQLPETPPEKGEEMEQIFSDFKNLILPGITHWQHPGWFGYFPANNSLPSVLGEFLTAGIGAQCMSWITSPAATELEEVVTDWLRDLIGLPGEMDGVIQDTASTSTLVALLTAREVASDFATNEQGMDNKYVVYASQEAHSSVEKGAKIAGFGRENIRYIPVDENFALIPEELERQIVADADYGYIPTCCVATMGTTSSGAIDPLEEIGKICKRRKIWLHVDAAYAGTAAILPEKRSLFQGIGHIDSFVFNPHKWMLTNFDCSVYFVRNSELLEKTMSINPEYLQTARDREVKNFRDWGIQLGRRFRALKLWFVLRSYGVEGIRDFLREHISFARIFADRVEQSNFIELMAPVELSLVCFRFNDGKRDEEELEELNHRLMRAINARGDIFLTHTRLQEQFTLRLAVGQWQTKKEHVDKAWQVIEEEAKKL